MRAIVKDASSPYDRGAVLPLAISALSIAPAREVVGCFGVCGSVVFRIRHLLSGLVDGMSGRADRTSSKERLQPQHGACGVLDRVLIGARQLLERRSVAIAVIDGA
jgi:hypothetical protein